MIKKFIAFSISLLIVFSLQSQEKSLIKKPSKNTGQPLTAREKYNIFLEKNNFYAFNSDDFNAYTTPEQTNKATLPISSKPSLYSQFNVLPVAIQDHITEYLYATQFSEAEVSSNEKLILIDSPEQRKILMKSYKKNIKSYLDLLSSSNKSKH